MDQDTDELLRVYARLTAMRANFASAQHVSAEVGAEFDSLLARASRSLERDFTEFKIAGLHHQINNRFHEGNAFRSKIDGAINYLTFLMPKDAKKQIGFDSGSD